MERTKRALKVGVIGPKGQCGSCIVDELLDRGHNVIGLSRSPPKTWKDAGNRYSAIAVDVTNARAFSQVLSSGEFDAVVCAFSPPLDDLHAAYRVCCEGHAKIKDAVLNSTFDGMFIVIGGAGSLHVESGADLADEPEFPFRNWYSWSDPHLNYMQIRAKDHGNMGFSRFIGSFHWARNNIEHPGWFSWMLRPLARLLMWRMKKFLTSPECQGVIIGSRMALRLWEGVTTKKWSFLSPPFQLRDKGVKTGKYEIFLDSIEAPAYQGVEGTIYNEDLAAAIADEIENPTTIHKHWTCLGPVGLKQ
jgi:putative NADH-flavin reductase